MDATTESLLRELSALRRDMEKQQSGAETERPLTHSTLSSHALPLDPEMDSGYSGVGALHVADLLHSPAPATAPTPRYRTDYASSRQPRDGWSSGSNVMSWGESQRPHTHVPRTFHQTNAPITSASPQSTRYTSKHWDSAAVNSRSGSAGRSTPVQRPQPSRPSLPTATLQHRRSQPVRWWEAPLSDSDGTGPVSAVAHAESPPIRYSVGSNRRRRVRTVERPTEDSYASLHPLLWDSDDDDRGESSLLPLSSQIHHTQPPISSNDTVGDMLLLDSDSDGRVENSRYAANAVGQSGSIWKAQVATLQEEKAQLQQYIHRLTHTQAALEQQLWALRAAADRVASATLIPQVTSSRNPWPPKLAQRPLSPSEQRQHQTGEAPAAVPSAAELVRAVVQRMDQCCTAHFTAAHRRLDGLHTRVLRLETTVGRLDVWKDRQNLRCRRYADAVHMLQTHLNHVRRQLAQLAQSRRR